MSEVVYRQQGFGRPEDSKLSKQNIAVLSEGPFGYKKEVYRLNNGDVHLRRTILGIPITTRRLDVAENHPVDVTSLSRRVTFGPNQSIRVVNSA